METPAMRYAAIDARVSTEDQGTGSVMACVRCGAATSPVLTGGWPVLAMRCLTYEVWRRRIDEPGSAFMTLIAVYTSEGCIGRCDAKGYAATAPQCDCICGGMNHGGGLAMAIENTRRHAEGVIEQYAGATGLQAFRAELGYAVEQRPLF
jgi:hypothetical protein